MGNKFQLSSDLMVIVVVHVWIDTSNVPAFVLFLFVVLRSVILSFIFCCPILLVQWSLMWKYMGAIDNCFGISRGRVIAIWTLIWLKVASVRVDRKSELAWILYWMCFNVDLHCSDKGMLTYFWMNELRKGQALWIGWLHVWSNSLSEMRWAAVVILRFHLSFCTTDSLNDLHCIAFCNQVVNRVDNKLY